MESSSLSNYNWEKITSGFTSSSWLREKYHTKFEKLAANVSTDVAIIGGGIAGMTTSYLLAKQGKKISLIDDGYIASGESGRTTAHVTVVLDERYYDLEKKYGKVGTKLVAESHAAAINLIESIITNEDIHCDFEKLDGLLFLDASDSSESLDKELLALHNAGISDAKIIIGSPLEHRGIGSCICISNQAQFNPLKYISGLAEIITSKYNGDIFTETHVQEINHQYDKCNIKTSNEFKIAAQAAVVASNAPIVDKVSKIYDKQQAYRSYVIGIKIKKNSIPKSLFWDTGNQRLKEKIKPYHYVRIQPKLMIERMIC